MTDPTPTDLVSQLEAVVKAAQDYKRLWTSVDRDQARLRLFRALAALPPDWSEQLRHVCRCAPDESGMVIHNSWCPWQRAETAERELAEARAGIERLTGDNEHLQAQAKLWMQRKWEAEDTLSLVRRWCYDKEYVGTDHEPGYRSAQADVLAILPEYAQGFHDVIGIQVTGPEAPPEEGTHAEAQQ